MFPLISKASAGSIFAIPIFCPVKSRKKVSLMLIQSGLNSKNSSTPDITEFISSNVLSKALIVSILNYTHFTLMSEY